MSDGKTSLRIDWFDGSLIQDTRQNANTSQFDDEESIETQTPSRIVDVERRPIGFKRLMDLSLLKPPILNLEISHRPGFWHLFDSELKGDFIVLIVKILSIVYTTLESGEKSKLTMLLQTRFVKSSFMINLKKYLNNLPSVRIVEKRLNMQLWNDAETFYLNVYELCEGMFKFHQSDIEILIEILDLLEITETSAVGVREKHMETIRDSFFTQIDELKKDILGTITKKNNETLHTRSELYNEDSTNFKNLQIFPTKDDLLYDSKIKIQPNIINGAYPSVEHYLDLQFKLLREDCFAPLREGISAYLRPTAGQKPPPLSERVMRQLVFCAATVCVGGLHMSLKYVIPQTCRFPHDGILHRRAHGKYMENPSKRKHENIRVYPKVLIIRTYVSNNKVGHLVDIAWQDRLTNGAIDKKQYALNKRLMFGSLLLFTSDQFETILCASVLDSNSHLLGDGYIVVSFQNPVSNKIYSEQYLMVESEVFFEPYHRVLKVLQSTRFDDLPMKKYIVDVQTEVHPPDYLTSETIYIIPSPKDQEKITFNVLELDKWPTNETFGLDDSQMNAFKFALTRQFAVVQGPPGTGKTFIGVKIASMLLKNLSLEGTPMLVICYTNHALDQFLEGILDITTNVIRLGRQSKSNILQNYTLNNMRGRIKSKYSYLYATKRAELERLYKEMTEIQTEIDKCENEIISYTTLKPFLKINNKPFELKTSSEDSIISWLFGHLDHIPENPNDEEDLDDWEKQCEDLSISDQVETCFSEEWALKEIQSMKNSIKYVGELTDDKYKSQKMVEKLQEQITKLRNRLNYFKKIMTMAHKGEYAKSNVMEVEDLYQLSPEKRWCVYFNATACLKDKLMNKMNNLMEQHNACSEELEEVSTLLDGELVRTARVVGFTTSAAARRHDLLRKLLSPIVIVEEAAEVFEAHIVASLTNHCKHLILIGDHKQLRPTAAHYKLAKDYNLEISLFERMLRNGVHARTLTTQRRMRSNFAQLLVPIIYEKLDSHPSVLAYPDVRGMKDNLYFYNHNEFEDSEGLEDSWSHKNTFEAKWCLALANYLRQMKYKAEEITVLATYTGQATLMRDLSKKYDLLKDVNITVVDNYQGEENRIVILSLVRSNRDGKIGFLSAGNRICVAMSRAKEGFYIFGNMDVLQSASSIWRCIAEKLKAQNAIGKRIVLCCETHKQNTYNVENLDDFDNCFSLRGSCLKNCS